MGSQCWIKFYYMDGYIKLNLKFNQGRFEAAESCSVHFNWNITYVLRHSLVDSRSEILV